MPHPTRPCPACGRPIIALRIFNADVFVDAEHCCYRITRDPATGGELVQEAPGCYAAHECVARQPERPVERQGAAGGSDATRKAREKPMGQSQAQQK